MLAACVRPSLSARHILVSAPYVQILIHIGHRLVAAKLERDVEGEFNVGRDRKRVAVYVDQGLCQNEQIGVDGVCVVDLLGVTSDVARDGV